MGRTREARPGETRHDSGEELRSVSGGGASSWCEMGRDALRAGDPAEALWFLRHAVEIDGDDPVTWHLMGRCFEEIGADGRARKCYLLAARQSLRSSETSDLLAHLPRRMPRKPREPRDA